MQESELFSQYINWDSLSKSGDLSEEFIERHVDDVNWGLLSINQRPLSEEFIERHTDKVTWNYICQFQTLSEAFIERHIDKINWRTLVFYQKLTKPFIMKYGQRMKIDWVYNKSFPSDCIQYIGTKPAGMEDYI